MDEIRKRVLVDRLAKARESRGLAGTVEIPEKLTLQQRKMAEGVKATSPTRLRLFLRVFAKQASKAEAIKAKCLDCGDLTVGGARHCTATGCPLWNYRPFQTGEGD